MGTGSWLYLINATPWSLVMTNNHSYQMNTWNQFPASIDPGNWVPAYIEQMDEGEVGDPQNDGGDISYSFTSGATFSIHYQGGALLSTSSISVTFSSVSTPNNPVGSVYSLDWNPGRNSHFILAGTQSVSSYIRDGMGYNDAPDLLSSNPPPNWMSQIYDRISCLQLNELCIPGTHDSGMSTFGTGSGGATRPNTLTQNLNIGDQLAAGARFFDIRPVLSGGDWFTGHYSVFDSGWVGGDGQSLEDVISEINAFTYNPDNQELIIIQLSHVYNTDNDPSDDCALKVTQAQWQDLLTRLAKTNYLVPDIISASDLTSWTVSQFIQNGPAVFYFIDDVDSPHTTPCDADYVDLTNFSTAGFTWQSQNMPLLGGYSDSDNTDFVISHQLGKLAANRTSADSPMFLLSWTRTKSAIDTIGAPFNRWIVQDAVDINDQLIPSLWPVLSPNSYPNVMQVDAFEGYMDITALAMAINYQFAPQC